MPDEYSARRGHPVLARRSWFGAVSGGPVAVGFVLATCALGFFWEELRALSLDGLLVLLEAILFVVLISATVAVTGVDG